MDWIKWRLPPSLQLPFIMQLFFLGGGKHGRFCCTPQFHRAPGVVTGARKCLMALWELKRHLLYTLVFFFCHCSLFSRFELVLATLLLKLFSRGCFGRRHQIHVCSLQWLQERGISWMRVLADIRHSSIETSLTVRPEGPDRACMHEDVNVRVALRQRALSLWWCWAGFFFWPNGAANREGEQHTVISAEVKHWPSQTWCKTHTWYVVWELVAGGWWSQPIRSSSLEVEERPFCIISSLI